MTTYAKKPQTNDDIAVILKSRGLAFDKDQLLASLAKVGYYRLKGYLVPFRQPDKVDFIKGADFATVKEIYDFDANLRMISRKIGQSKEVAALDACFKADGVNGFDSVFDILSVTRHLVKVADPSSPWLADIASVVTDATPFILTGMGFPADWQKLALWQ